MIRLLTLTSLYPNSEQPRHGIFIETRLKKMLEYLPELETIVIAPVPWFPINSSRFKTYAKFARVPKKENRNGIQIYHPRYLVIPKIGMSLAPILMFLGVFLTIKKLKKEYDFDLIDAHYFYPDGVAAALLSKVFGTPLVISARGSDINLIPNYLLPRKMILWAANQTKAIIAVSNALAIKMKNLGMEKEKIHVCRNGVDLALFCPPKDRAKLREELGIKNNTLLMVGNLVPLKGHELVLKVLRDLSDFHLIVIGIGPECEKLKKLAEYQKITDRISFIPEMTQRELVDYYGTADALILASSREGMPNVVLESIACGTPVVATDVGGVSEVVSPVTGIVVKERSVEVLQEAIVSLFVNYPSRDVVRKEAKQLAWDNILQKQMCVMEASRVQYSGVDK